MKCKSNYSHYVHNFSAWSRGLQEIKTSAGPSNEDDLQERANNTRYDQAYTPLRTSRQYEWEF